MRDITHDHGFGRSVGWVWSVKSLVGSGFVNWTHKHVWAILPTLVLTDEAAFCFGDFSAASPAHSGQMRPFTTLVSCRTFVLGIWMSRGKTTEPVEMPYGRQTPL